MKYTFSVDASFCFDIDANSPEEARRAAHAKLHAFDPVDDSGGVNPAYDSPWVAVAGADEAFPSLEITDTFNPDDELPHAPEAAS